MKNLIRFTLAMLVAVLLLNAVMPATAFVSPVHITVTLAVVSPVATPAAAAVHERGWHPPQVTDWHVNPWAFVWLRLR